MEEAKIRSACVSAFRFCGLNLQKDAISLLVQYLTNYASEAETSKRLNEITDALLKQSLSSTLVDKNTLEKAIEDYHQRYTGTEILFTIINAFEVPKFDFLLCKQRFKTQGLSDETKLDLLGSVDDKINVYRERYALIHQRILRHDYFLPSFGAGGTKFELQTVETLLALPEGSVQNCICLGMISQLKENKYYLEDLTGFVELNLSDARFQSGLFTENSLVLVEGAFVDSVFNAVAVGLPPIENSQKTREFYGNLNFFGGTSKLCAKGQPRLEELERQNSSTAFAFLSEVYLDDAQVLEKLRQLFSGFSINPPLCFVLCGRFLSKYESTGNIQALKDGFKALVDILMEFPSVLNYSHFVFIPSLQDPLLTSIFPKPPLPSSALAPYLSKIPNHHLATNPCRLQYCTQEIVIFREDVVEKMCRNCVRVPDDVGRLQKHFVRTILSQNHLAPFSLMVSPVHWSFDHSMYLYPLPDLVVCCDKFKQFTEKSHDCTVINPGSFSTNGFAFQMYYPSTKQIDDSVVPDD